MVSSEKMVAVGDIHGCIASLEALIKKLISSAHSESTFIFVGDYTDRGPSSKEVIDFLIDFSSSKECVFIRGNHDQMMLDAVLRDDWRMWLYNGGETTLKSYGATTVKFNLPENHIKFLKETVLFHETEDYLFVHGGIDPVLTVQENLEKKDTQDFMWIRDHISAPWNNWEKTVVFGHTPVHEPINKNHMLGIDTGCVYKKRGYGKLTAVVLPETEFVQQECLDL